MSSSHIISPANGPSTSSKKLLTTTLISMLRTCSSLTSFLNSNSLVMINHVKPTTCSITQRVLEGLTEKWLSKVGQTITLPLCPLGKWAWVLTIQLLMIFGVGGIGRRFWAWVPLTLSAMFDLTTNCSLGELLFWNLLKVLLIKAKHVSENKKFDATKPKNLHEQWLTMIWDWESAKLNLNPYTYTEAHNTCTSCCIASYAHVFQPTNLTGVHQQLAKADKEDIAQGIISHQILGSVFICSGFELEGQQLVSLYCLYANQILIVNFITGDQWGWRDSMQCMCCQWGNIPRDKRLMPSEVSSKVVTLIMLLNYWW